MNQYIGDSSKAGLKTKLERFRFNYIGLPLIKFAYKIRFLVLKKSLKTQLSIHFALKILIRALDPDSRLHGYDEHTDKMVHLATWKITHQEEFEEDCCIEEIERPEDLKKAIHDLRQDYFSNKEVIDKLASKAINNENIRSLVVRYFLVMNFTETLQKKTKTAQQHLTRARELDASAEPLEAKHLWEIDRKTKKKYKSIRNEIADKTAVKISFDEINIGAFLSILSALFLTSGFLYEYTFLGAFGIDVTRYFTLADYLASSMEAIRFSLVGAIFALIGFIFRVNGDSRMSPSELEYNNKQNDKMYYFLLATSIAATAYGYFYSKEMMFAYLQLTSLLLIFRIPARFYIRYFAQPLQAYVIISITLIFSLYLYTSARKEVYEAKVATPSSVEETFLIDPNIKIPSKSLLLLAANSQYFFFLNTETKKTLVLSKQRIFAVEENE